MAQETIVFTQGGELPPDIVALAEQMKPAGFTLLKLVQVLSAGYDRVNIEGARKARVPICSNGGANSVAVAEHTLMLILAVYRKLVTFHQNVAAGRWHQGIPRTVDVYELEGKTVGLVGLGHIGQQVARRLTPFETHMIYYDTFR